MIKKFLPFVVLLCLFGCQQKNTFVMSSSLMYDNLILKLSITPDTNDSSWLTLVVTNYLPLNRYYISNSIDVTWDDKYQTLKLLHLPILEQDSASLESKGLFLQRTRSYTINKRIANKFTPHTYVSLTDAAMTLAIPDPRDTTDLAHRQPQREARMGAIMVAPRDFDHKKATDTAVYLFMDGFTSLFFDAKLEVSRKKDGTALLALHIRNESKNFPISTGMHLNPVWNKDRTELSINVAPRSDLDAAGLQQQVIPVKGAKTITDVVPDHFNSKTTIIIRNIHYLLKGTPDPVTGLRPPVLNELDMHELGVKFNIQPVIKN